MAEKNTGKIKEIKKGNVDFYINEEKKTVMCLIHTKEYGEAKGKSVCDDIDKFDENLGMLIAYSRASEKLKRYKMEDNFDRSMVYLEIAEEYAAQALNCQSDIDSLRKDRAELCGMPYDSKLEGYELKKLRYEYGRMNKKEEDEFKTLDETLKEERKCRIKAALNRKNKEEEMPMPKDEEEAGYPDYPAKEQTHVAHERPIQGKPVDSCKKGLSSVLIEME